MRTSPQFTGSIWFVTLAGLFISLGAQVLIGALTPFSTLAWLDNESRQDSIVLIAGQTSFWRGDSIIRATSFGLGTSVACLLANSQSWYLVASLVAVSLLASVFAQFPGAGTLTQMAIWAAAAPVASLAVGTIFRVWKGDA